MSETSPETELLHNRKLKVQQFKDMGQNPYAYRSDRTCDLQTVKDQFDQFLADSKTLVVAGRIRAIRPHGGSCFMQIEDMSTRLQVYFKKDEIGEDRFKSLTLYDLGDFIEVTGHVFTTHTGEPTLKVHDFRILAKALRALPSEWYGLKDTELRHRKRYIDLLLNPEVKKTFIQRARIIQLVRDFLTRKNFVEVETPVLQVLYGGTNAKPFQTHINAFDMDMYLRIAPELYLKRLVVGGIERVFEIARNFRNEGVDLSHNPEFTMIEWYEAYADYHIMMDTAEAMYKFIARDLYGKEEIPYQDGVIDLSAKWQRLPLKQAILQYTQLDVDKMTDDQINAELNNRKITVKGQGSLGQKVFALFDKLVAHQLINPIWIIDYPRDVSPLSKEHRDNPELVERFECYIGGREIGDGWSEIVSAIEQRERFENEQRNMQSGDDEAQPTDEDFLEAMEYGLPPLGGIGIGIDRLVMTFTNTDNIREVILFPIMKPVVNKTEFDPNPAHGKAEPDPNPVVARLAPAIPAEATARVAATADANQPDNSPPPTGPFTVISRPDALALLNSLTKNPALIKHARTVETAMKFYAKQLGGDEATWTIAGLLHDADYEAYPAEHPKVIVKKLQDMNVDPAIPQAIACHGSVFGIPQLSQMDKALFASDELCGFITAVTYVRPDKKVASVEVKSVLKKMKDKAFARNVNREDITTGAAMLGITLEQHVQNVLTAMQQNAGELGL